MRVRSGIGLATLAALGVIGSGWIGAAGCGGSSDTGGTDTDSGVDGGDDVGNDDTNPTCGNKIVEGVEECDDGNDKNGDGCENDCTFTCKPGDPLRGDAKCDDKNSCDGVEKCQADHTCSKGTTAPDGTACGTGKVCKAGACVGAVCGDKIVTPPEECDDGNAINGDGCDNCKFSCVSTDATRDCTPSDPCKGKGTCDDTKHTCSAGTPLADGTACGTGKVCKSGTCTLATCGNGVIDPGEECDPPDGTTCDATCHKIKVAACGDATRDTGEQCDDGNTANLDGCSGTCTFEQDHRANQVSMIYDTSVCSANALGGAMGSAAQGQIKTALDKGVKDGSTTIAFEFLKLSDLTGTSATGLSLGGITGKAVAAPAGATYDGTADLDWWYTTDSTVIDATRTPTAQLPGSITAKHLAAGPGTLSLVLSLGSGPAPVKVTQATVNADIGATSTPTASTGSTPGHLSSEHDDPALVSFGTMSNGKMCGNVSARSLAAVPAPTAIVSGGAINCGEGYTTANSLLDVIVGGCHVLIFITAIKSTQPDQFDSAASSPGGAGAPYSFVEDKTSRKVTGCQDSAKASVPLDACLDYLAYSASFTFGTDRVVAK
jgi:cysteine-rich repeat protein